MGRWYDYPFFKPSIPREAKGGIKSQSKRGTFGESWWARRWIAVLESFDIGARLGRGRSYARRGQVVSIEIEKGNVSAKVQGSRPKPYDIKLQIKSLHGSRLAEIGESIIPQSDLCCQALGGRNAPGH